MERVFGSFYVMLNLMLCCVVFTTSYLIVLCMSSSMGFQRFLPTLSAFTLFSFVACVVFMVIMFLVWM